MCFQLADKPQENDMSDDNTREREISGLLEASKAIQCE